MMKTIKLFENFDMPDFKPGEVYIAFYDWKESLGKEDYNRLATAAKVSDGHYEELPVTSADSKIFAAGPDEFFKWFEDNADEYGGCAHQMFLDNDSRYDPETEDTIEQVTEWFMKGDELYAKTDKDKEYKYSDWVNEITAE